MILKPEELKRGMCIKWQGGYYTVIESRCSNDNENSEAIEVKLRDIVNGEVIEASFGIREMLETAHLEPRWLSYKSWDESFTDALDVSYEVIDIPESKLFDGGEWLDDDDHIGEWSLALYVDGELISVGPDGFVELEDFIIKDSILVRYTGDDEEVVVPDGVTAIGQKAFYGFWGRDQVRHVTLPEGLTEIGSRAFYNCKNLEEVDLPSTLKRIGDSAFDGQNDGRRCKIKRIVFPSSLREIDDSAFYCCKSLEEVVFSEGLKRVGKDAFSGTSVKKFVLPDSLKKVGRGAFEVGHWVSDAIVEAPSA